MRQAFKWLLDLVVEMGSAVGEEPGVLRDRSALYFDWTFGEEMPVQ
jgi:hypothetical protein